MGLWTKKSLKELSLDTIPEKQRLKRALTATDLVLLGIGAVVGAGLFSITGIAAANHAGPAITLAFLIAALGCALAGLCYSEMASMIPVSGSAYTYTYATMGQFLAWIMGWDLVLEYAIGAATVSISWSAYIVSFFNAVGIHLPPEWTSSPWQSVRLPDGSEAYGYLNVPAVFIVTLISILLIIGIKTSSVLNAIIVGIKLAVVFVFIGVGFFFINYDNFSPYIPPNEGEFGSFGFTGILRAAGVLFFAYIGFDAVSTAAQETKNPKRDLPIGILGSLAICTVIYVLFGFVLTGIVNYTELNVADPVALAASRIPFAWIDWFIKLAILAGLTSVILVMLLGQSRIFYTMSRDGLLPQLFSTLHPRFKTPWYSNLMLMVFTGLIGGLAPLSAVGHVASIGTLLAFVIVCTAVLILRYTDPHHPRGFVVPFFPIVPLLGIAVCLTMMLSLDSGAWLRLGIWISIGLIIYFSYGYRKSKVGI
jgi:APA family basic amino acid/polyamine antiporter